MPRESGASSKRRRLSLSDSPVFTGSPAFAGDDDAGGAVHDLPYTGTTPPRVTLFSGEARKAIVAATSSTLGQAAKSAFGMAARFAAVSRMEGATALTRIPSLATSSASATVSAATAALLAV